MPRNPDATLGALLRFDRAGYRYWVRFGVFMRVTVLSHGGRKNTSALVEVKLVPITMLPGNQSKKHEAYRWWENISVENALAEAITRIVVAKRLQFEKRHTFLLDEEGKLVPKKPGAH